MKYAICIPKNVKDFAYFGQRPDRRHKWELYLFSSNIDTTLPGRKKKDRWVRIKTPLHIQNTSKWKIQPITWEEFFAEIL